MAEKKKQHYVPRFYLKLFSWGDKKAINIYNIINQHIITRANLKNQCYEPYFYGQNLVAENAFGNIEEVASPIINQIIDSKSAPRRNTKEHHAILSFVLLQHSRTKYAAEAHDEMTDKLIKVLLEKEGKLTQKELDNVKIKNKNPTALPLKAAALYIPTAMDLMFKVLVNKTNLNFITSDNPVVLYNLVCERSVFGSHTGIARKGLKIIFPISPKHVLLFYDEKIYKVGAKRQLFADVIEDKDVRQFNDLQWLNALENVYFDDASLRAEILRGAKDNIKRRYTQKAHLNEYQREMETEGTRKILLHMYKPDLNIRMNMQCIRQLRVVSEEEMNNRAKFVRDPELLAAHHEFLSLVDADKYKGSEFKLFINDKLRNINSESNKL